MRACWLVCLATGVAADPVSTGERGDVSVDRHAEQTRMLFTMRRTPDSGLAVLGFPYTIHAGEEYDLITEKGRVGRVHIQKVEQTNENCQSTTYTVGHVDLVSGLPGDIPPSVFSVVAVGPSSSPSFAKARLLDPASADAVSLPPPGRAPTLIQLADLDGDGQPDLARYFFDCAGGVNVNLSSSTACIRDWARTGDRWAVVADARIACRDQ